MKPTPTKINTNKLKLNGLQNDNLKLELNKNYEYSKQNLIDKINDILQKMDTIPNESKNKVEMIRIIYNIALKYSIKDIKRKIEKKYSRMVDNFVYNFKRQLFAARHPILANLLRSQTKEEYYGM
jgi:hypothetical protein